MLCHIVTSANRSRYAAQLDEMYRQRHQVFVEDLGWREIRRADQRDIDDYDTDATVYLLVMGDAGEVFASGRLNPTWARHQLEADGALRQKFAMKEPPRGPLIWEGSRLLGGFPKKHGKDFARETLGVLLAGTQEFCARRGVYQCISILETPAFGRFSSLGWKMEGLGLPVRYDTDRGDGFGDAMSAIWSTGPRELAMTRQAFGIQGPVMFEASPFLGEHDEASRLDFGLLDSAAELQTRELQQTALETIHRLIEIEVAQDERRRSLN